ncbi:MAG: hypothetical protein J0I17_03695 ['Candidatus Kapabacteria' thiocyanatum]|nr:hypothetical protein ['Candidatus Kapabacteria' thiocyanatum]
MLSIGVAFVLAARFFGPAQAGASCVSMNAFAMELLFGRMVGAAAWYQVFPVFEALLMIFFLGRTNSRAVWIVVIALAVLVSIPILPAARVG